MDGLSKLERWLHNNGKSGDLELSFEELSEVKLRLSREVIEGPSHVIRTYERYGPYLTRAFILQCLARSEGLTLAYLESSSHNSPS